MISHHNMIFHSGTVQVRHYDGTVETISIPKGCATPFIGEAKRSSAGACIHPLRTQRKRKTVFERVRSFLYRGAA